MDDKGDLEALAGGHGAGLRDAAARRGANGDFETAVLLPSPMASPGWAPRHSHVHMWRLSEVSHYDDILCQAAPHVIHENSGMQLLFHCDLDCSSKA